MKKKIEMYKKYCAGCGLCHSVKQTPVHYENGFLKPDLAEKDLEFCENVCPANGNHIDSLNEDYPWGKFLLSGVTWSNDEKIRYEASSGGTLSTIAIYLLENKIVDEIIQIRKKDKKPIETEYTISKNAEEIRKCSGSRYTVSSPLIELLKVIKPEKKYAFIGKPCDVLALKNYMKKVNPELKKNIIITMSFFCAGMPSRQANLRLLKELQSNEKVCNNLIYRGRGWPGYATATNEDGKSFSMTYNDSWGHILGRDINYFCRFCMDGIGEFADISCGDAWYLTLDKQPDFSEHDGRNITFARTEIGKKILLGVVKNGKIVMDNYNLEELKYIQNYQYMRRSQIYSRILGLKICGKLTPEYSLKNIKHFSVKLTFKEKIKITLGTIKRVIKGKM